MARKKGGKKKGQRPPPVCKAILLCQTTMTEVDTNYVSVIRILDEFLLPDLPCAIGPLTVFFQVVNGIGSYETLMEVQDLQDGGVLFRVENTIEFSDRLTPYYIAITIPSLFLTHPGVYDVVLLADGQEIDRQQFTAKLEEGPDHGGE
ncbi:MAG TPA: hypothetical protein VKS79_06490 [Gemmataceae bacterium]|nr:hypothetical protein [Gemmataceae bacterium]